MTAITFLGTSSMVPTKERNHSAIYLTYKGEGILFDCGEGTQRQIKHVGIRPSRIRKLIISHWHGDHILGIPGLLQTMGHNEYPGTLDIYGPRGTERFIKKMMEAFAADFQVSMKIHELDEGDTIDEKGYRIRAHRLNHSVTCLGYRFEEKDKRHIDLAATKKLKIPEGPLLGKLQKGKDIDWNGKTIKASEATKISKGKTIGFIFDTRLCENCYTIAKDTDIVISEATFTHALEENATQFKHMTAHQAGNVAKLSNAKKLILTHFSQRYKQPDELIRDAKKEFENTEPAQDFMKVQL